MRIKCLSLVALFAATMLIVISAAPALAGPNVLPQVTAFEIPPTATSPVPISVFTATDSDGTVAGYLITETSAKPSATASGWSATAPTTYTTANTGTVTLYAWAKDNRSGVSASLNRTVVIAAATPEPRLVTVGKNGSGADFTDVQTAINSLAEAGGVVKVFPGTYEVSSPVQMMENVTLEGSGQESTQIAGNIAYSGGYGCVSAVPPAIVVMAPNSVLRDIGVVNTTTGSGGLAVEFYNTTAAKAVRVRAVAKGTVPSGSALFGFKVEGPLADVVLDQVYAESNSLTPKSGDNAAIGAFCSPKLLITRSHAVGMNGHYNIGIALAEATTTSGSLTIRDSVIEAGGDAGDTMALLPGAGESTPGVVEVHGTKVTADCISTARFCHALDSPPYGLGLVDHSDLYLLNPTNLDPCSARQSLFSASGGKIAASGLYGEPVFYTAGGCSIYFTDGKIIGCWNANLDPVSYP